MAGARAEDDDGDVGVVDAFERDEGESEVERGVGGTQISRLRDRVLERAGGTRRIKGMLVTSD